MSLASGNNRGFILGLIGLLLVFLIVGYLFYLMMNIYFKPASLYEEVDQSSNQPVTDTPNYQPIIKTTRDKLSDITRQQNAQIENLTEFGN